MADVGATSQPLGERRWRRRERRRPFREVPWLWVIPGALIAFLFHYVAIAAGGWYAFTDWNGITANAHFVGLRNFRSILHDPVARGALEHTVELAFAFVVVVNGLGLALALALNRAVKSRHILRALFFAPVVMSPLAVSYVWHFIFDYSGPLNSVLGAVDLGSIRRAWVGDPVWALWTVFVVLVWQFAGLTMVMYLAGLQGIPEELDEAAAVDGASSFFRFRRVTMPLLAPAFTIALTYTLVLGLRVFDQIVAMTGGGPAYASETLSTQVWEQTFAFGRFGYGAAFALVLTVLITVAALAQLAFLRAQENRL